MLIEFKLPQTFSGGLPLISDAKDGVDAWRKAMNVLHNRRRLAVGGSLGGLGIMFTIKGKLGC